MSDQTLRQQLHNAAVRVENAFADRMAAERTYNTERDKLNDLIDKVTPLDHPNGVVTIDSLRAVLPNRKIALIKLVREAVSKHVDFLRAQGVAVPAMAQTVGLAEAKTYVENWIDNETGRAIGQ